MRHSLKYAVILFSSLCLCTNSVWADKSKNTFQTPDFDFPQEVEANARPVLEKALQEGDQNKAVRATLQICESRLVVSFHKMTEVIALIDSIRNVGHFSPDYRTLLYLYESCAVDRIGNYKNGGDDESDDISLWTRAKRDSLKNAFLDQALDPQGNGDISSLLTPVTKYKNIINPSDKWGKRCLPYLYDLGARLKNEHLECWEKATPKQKEDFKQQWLSVHAQDKDLYATIYIEDLLLRNSPNREKSLDELIEKYRNKEEVGLLYCRVGEELPRLKFHTLGKEYVKKFPHAECSVDIKNRVAHLESIANDINFPNIVPSDQPLKVDVSFNCLFQSRTKLSLYRVPQDLRPYRKKITWDVFFRSHQLYDLYRSDYYRTKQLELVEERIVEKGKEGEPKSTLFSPLPYGIYFLEAAIESPQGEWSCPKDYEEDEFERHLITVSDIRSFAIQEKDENQIFALDARNGAPLENVTLWNPYKYVSGFPVPLGKTDKNGCLKQIAPTEHWQDYTMTLREDKYLNAPIQRKSFSFGRYYERNQTTPIVGQILTDLAIYRPGDTLQATVMLYEQSATERKALRATSTPSSVTLYDSNGKAIENKLTDIDEWGQIQVKFRIPKDRMNGTFSIVANVDRARIERKYFEVSEYKAPTFYVDLSNTPEKQALDKPAIIRGKVMTFSGMPLSFRNVKCELTLSSFWNSYYFTQQADFGQHDFTVMTDEAGNFEYICPAEWTILQEDADTGKRCRVFQMQVKATCSNASGETQSSSCSFRLGKGRRISLAESDFLLSYGEAACLPIQFESTEENEKEALCDYSLQHKEGGETVKRGIFSTSVPAFDWDQIPSGCYVFKATIQGDESAIGIEKEITLFRATDTTIPAGKEGLWIPEKMQSVTPEGKARILIGNSRACHILYIAQSRAQIMEKRRIEYPAGLHWFELPMPEGKDEKLNVEFFTCIDGKPQNTKVTLLSPNQEEIHLKTITFRDKVAPGSKQHWTLQLTDEQGKPLQGRMVLDIYDMALEKLNSNRWDFKATYWEPKLYDRSFTRLDMIKNFWADYPENSRRFWYSDWYIAPPYLLINQIHRYSRIDGALEGRVAGTGVLSEVAVVGYGRGIKGLAGKLSGSIKKASTRSNSYMNATITQMDVEEAMVANIQDGLENVSVRAAKTHVALWRPTLTSDQEGNFQIEFDVPDDNTTWSMQALAFSRTMATCLMQKEILAQRTLMAQPSLPRFLRSGDRTTLMANVQNAADSAVKAVAVVELFDPRTDKVLKKKQFTLNIGAKGTEVVGIECEAPLDEPYIGFRIKVVDGQGNGDGEQQKLPVLPSTSPVIEGQPFFLTAGQQTLTLDVHRPSVGKSHSVLTACSNPTWYCISALPSIARTDWVTSTGLAHNLFALDMAASLVKNEPVLDKESRLRQDQDLKLTTLQASPWARAADQQEEQMQALSRLLNPEQNRADYNALKNKLLELQKENGGFRWSCCERDTSASYWATSIVLQLLGRLRLLGCLQEDEKLSAALIKALQYLDKEVLAELKDDLVETGKVDMLDYGDYAYIYTLFDKDRPYTSTAIKLSTSLLRNRILSAMEKRWHDLSLTNRAFCAVTLQRSGHEKEAQRIVESFRQLAINDKDKGMYWERLENFWSHPVAHTATILEAMNEVSAEQYVTEIERVRQWLLLEKQTSDWGGSSMAADAVYALLRTGGDWLHAEVDTTPLLQIKIDGKPVDYKALNPLLGNMRMDLPADARRVEIVKSENHPAWGAVVHQYEAPMQEVKKQGVKELTLRKELWAQDDNGEWRRLSLESKKNANLHLGQKVQVRLIITCTKALEYLTLTDERPATLEPVDQLSRHGWEDFFYYQETKDSQTNFFIRRLSEGEHVLTYDCYVTNTGTFSVGIATIQSQMAPQFVAHSAGGVLNF